MLRRSQGAVVRSVARFRIEKSAMEGSEKGLDPTMLVEVNPPLMMRRLKTVKTVTVTSKTCNEVVEKS
jgi:hypothetical protein